MQVHAGCTLTIADSQHVESAREALCLTGQTIEAWDTIISTHKQDIETFPTQRN